MISFSLSRCLVGPSLCAWLGCIFVMLLAGPDSLAEENADGDSSRILLVVGAPGTEEYGETFAVWAAKWDELAQTSDTPITSIGRSGQSDLIDREQLSRAIAAVPVRGRSPLWIVLIGHGTYARGVAKFNLRGPDVSAAQLAQWLEPLERPVVVVNCASASGPFVNRLSGVNRIVITATRSGTEQNYARFGGFFSNAIASPETDLDHDDEVSVHEAFLLASAAVRNFYEVENRIVTEHALIDDNGDGKGTPATMFRGTRAAVKSKDGTKLDGSIALRIALSPAEKRLPFTEAELEERSEIEDQLDQLRSKKDAATLPAYHGQIEPLLLRLAKIYRAAESRAADKTPGPATEP